MIFYRQLQKITAMTFDLDDTLYDNHPFILKAEQKLLAFLQQHSPCGTGTDTRYWRRHKLTVLDDHPELHGDMGLLRRKTLTRGLAELGYKSHQLDKAVDDAFAFFYHQRSNFKVSSEVCKILDSLAARLPLIAITNGNVNLQQIGIGDYFQKSFHASLAFPMKPASNMFDAAQQFLQRPASEILHIGDDLQKDIQGAKQAGFSSAWYAYNRTMHLKNEPVSLMPDIQLTSLDELCTLL
ncbi:MAG: HAD superfamily hydrolase (TIGR01549 family) [Paraglaciecola sp.]|jgi:HAD superfamily hydrolase (TIGR01549 family)